MAAGAVCLRSQEIDNNDGGVRGGRGIDNAPKE